MVSVTPPRSEAELLERARALSGRSLGVLAEGAGIRVPLGLGRAKGFVGQLLEVVLGANAKSRAVPDFEELGVELKSLPVDARGRAVESTFVCSLSLREAGEVEWERSKVWAKLRRVLFIPVEGSRHLPPLVRRVGSPLLWSPTPEQAAALREDWDSLSVMVGAGRAEEITGHFGRYLQVRPKAKNSAARSRYFDEDGAIATTLPRGFYLRATFTSAILQDHFVLPRRQNPE